jgi:GTP-binding protein
MVMPEFGEPFAVADIPGIIEGAHSGTGLGIRFLKHVERTGVLIHLIDVSEIDPDAPLETLNLINRELSLYSSILAEKPQLVVLNKIDLTGSEEKVEQFKLAYEGREVLALSAATGEGTKELVQVLAQRLANGKDSDPENSDLGHPAPKHYDIKHPGSKPPVQPTGPEHGNQ